MYFSEVVSCQTRSKCHFILWGVYSARTLLLSRYGGPNLGKWISPSTTKLSTKTTWRNFEPFRTVLLIHNSNSGMIGLTTILMCGRCCGNAAKPAWKVRTNYFISHEADDYTTANQLFSEASLQAPHHDLSECIDREGYVYRIEKFCYSNPSNMMIGKVDEGCVCFICSDIDTTLFVGEEIVYQFRIQSVNLD